VLHHAIANMVEGGHQWSDEDGELPPTYARSIGNGKVFVGISPESVTEPSSNTLPLLWELARGISWRTLVVAQELEYGLIPPNWPW
jgi:hypothetical protein